MSATSAPAAAAPPHDAFIDAWRTFSRSMQRAKTRGCQAGELSLPQALLLVPLLDGEPLAVGVLAASADVAKPTATRMLDGLARGGYLERHHGDADRRTVLVSLTPKGAAALQARWAAFHTRIADFSAALSPQEREQTTLLLRRLAALMDEI